MSRRGATVNRRGAAVNRRGAAVSRRAVALGLEITVTASLFVAGAVWFNTSDSYYFPAASQIAETFADTWLFARVASDVVPSLARLLAGLAVAVVVAVVAGLWLGLVPRARHACRPLIEFLRAIPPPALLPFGLLLIGVGDTMKVFVIALGCTWPVLLNTIDGVSGMDSTYGDTARAYQIGRRDHLWHVVLPAASPQIAAGIRTSLSLGLILMVISEMVASENGIGYFVLQSQRTFATAEMWSGILLLGLLGIVLNGGFRMVERWLLRWHRGARASGLE